VAGSVGKRSAARVRRDVMVTCRDCGDVVVAIGRCELRRCDDDGTYSLSYLCSGCGCRDIVGQLHANEIAELIDAGLDVVAWRLPSELFEARSTAPTVTPDDLLDFHLLLEREGWWKPLLGS
jgi:hypothetical protein